MNIAAEVNRFHSTENPQIENIWYSIFKNSRLESHVFRMSTGWEILADMDELGSIGPCQKLAAELGPNWQ